MEHHGGSDGVKTNAVLVLGLALSKALGYLADAVLVSGMGQPEVDGATDESLIAAHKAIYQQAAQLVVSEAQEESGLSSNELATLDDYFKTLLPTATGFTPDGDGASGDKS